MTVHALTAKAQGNDRVSRFWKQETGVELLNHIHKNAKHPARRILSNVVHNTYKESGNTIAESFNKLDIL